MFERLIERIISPTRLQLTAIDGHLSRLESKIVQLTRDVADARAEVKGLRPDPIKARPVNAVIAVDWDQVQELNAAAFNDDKMKREAMRFIDGDDAA